MDTWGLWVATSNRLWSRMQTASVIEGGTLAGAYTVSHDGFRVLGFELISLGSLLLAILSVLILRDAAYLGAVEHVAQAKNRPVPKPKGFSIGRYLAFVAPLILVAGNFLLATAFAQGR